MQQAAGADGVEDAEALALHFGAGGDPTREAHYAELAGDRALAVSALDRARRTTARHWRALERAELVGEHALRWVDIVQRLAMVCMFDPERSQIALAERALALAERHGEAATRGAGAALAGLRPLRAGRAARRHRARRARAHRGRARGRRTAGGAGRGRRWARLIPPPASTAAPPSCSTGPSRSSAATAAGGAPTSAWRTRWCVAPWCRATVASSPSQRRRSTRRRNASSG